MELKTLTKYRSVWMALAIFWVVFFHAELKFENSLMNYIKLIGYGGVDIFVFASGMGCYFSLLKNENTFLFLKKRCKKILPMYWIVLIPWVIFKLSTSGITIPQIIGNFFCVQSFSATGNDFNWYVSAMWLYYLLIPVFFLMIKNQKEKISHLVILILTILFSLSFLNSFNFIIIFTRIPLLFLGICLGKYINENIRLKKIHCFFAILCCVIGFCLLKFFIRYYETKLWLHGLWWYPFILITPGLCMLISFICYLCDKNKIGRFIVKGFEYVGNHTFEIYLVHILLFEIFKYCTNNGYIWNNNRNWILLIFITAIGSILLTFVNNLFTKIIVTCITKKST